MTECSRAVSSVASVVLLVAVVVVLAATLSVFVLQVGEGVSDSGPNVDVRIEYSYLGDGVAKNDSITITHAGGDVLERDQLEVVVGDDVVYNETADSETTNGEFTVPGLVVEVDPGDEFNDLNKPCRVDGERVSPNGTCGGPPGDSDGSDPGVVMQWSETVSAGERIVIQERTDTRSADVIQPGETVTVVYRGDGISTLLTEETVPER